MEQFKELLGIITRYKRNQLQVIGYDSGVEASQYDKLYDFMVANPEASFEECMNLLFPPEKRKQFTNLLGRFKIRLLNAIFLIDVKKTNYGSRNEAYYIGWKHLAAIKILLRFGAKIAAEDLVKQSIKIAVPNENFAVIAELYRIQSDLIAHRADHSQAKAFFDRFQYYHHVYLKLSRAKYLYANLQALLFHRKSTTNEITDVILAANNELEDIVAEYDYDLIWTYYYLIKYNYYASQKKIDQIIYLMQEAITKLADSKAITTGTIGTFYHIKMVNLAALGRYEEVISLSKKADSYLMGTHSLNYFVGKEFLCLVLLYKGDYQEVLNVYNEVKKNRFLSKLSPYKRENWILIEAFLQLLNLSGKIQTSTQLKLPRFSVSKFANEVIYNNKDKQGFNVSYQILQTLFLLATDKLDQAEDKIMALYKYGQRHLQYNPDTERSFYFINALVQIPRGGFYRKEVEKRATTWFDKMKAIPAMQTTDPFEVEILPYQRLWEIGMELLAKSQVAR